MNGSLNLRLSVAVVITVLGVMGASTILAVEPTAADWKTETPVGPTKEDRERMARGHENIASCLRSDRSMTECRQEMMKARDAMMDEAKCSHGDTTKTSHERTH